MAIFLGYSEKKLRSINAMEENINNLKDWKITTPEEWEKYDPRYDELTRQIFLDEAERIQAETDFIFGKSDKHPNDCFPKKFSAESTGKTRE